MIDAVASEVATAPRPAFTAVETRPGSIARLYRGARGLIGRERQRPDVPVDVIPLPASPSERFSILRWSFILCVVLPALAGAVYFGAIAADQFVAEMRFVVRFGPQDSGASSMSSGGSLVMSAATRNTTSTSSTEDAYIVTSYIRSRAMVDDLSKRVNLREIFARPEADLVNRLKDNATAEELVEYWGKMVSTFIEGTSGIVTVEIRAFRPEDAVLLATHVEQLSERLVNDISTRARTDGLRRASEELERAQGLMYASLQDMERYRNAEGMIDPTQTATETGKILTQVLTDQLSAENQLFVARQSLSPEAASVRSLQTRVDGLRQQVATLRQQIAGNKNEARNVAAAIARYEKIAVQQKMAESLYTLAANGLDRARRTAESQSIYLTTFVHPRIPEEYSYPRRIFNPFALAISCLVLWSIVVLICASVQDHRLN